MYYSAMPSNTSTLPDPSDLDLLRQFDLTGDTVALGRFLLRHQDRLRAVVVAHMGRRLATRLDPSDVVQESSLGVPARVAGYLRQVTVPPYVWLRFLALQQLHQAARWHLGTQRRAVGREARGGPTEAGRLIDPVCSPVILAILTETRRDLRTALAKLSAADQRMLGLRYYDQRDNAGAARALGMTPNTASVNHFRALRRLREVLDRQPSLDPNA